MGLPLIFQTGFNKLGHYGLCFQAGRGRRTIWAMGDMLGIRDEDFKFSQLKHIQTEMSRNNIGRPAGMVADSREFANDKSWWDFHGDLQ